MAYCPNCGTLITEAVNFCPNCGANLNGVTGTVQNIQTNTLPANAIYRVILIDKGDCTKALCKDVLHDLLGYTLTSAGSLIDAMPVEIARNLTREQAVYIAQVLTDYGMNTTICDNKNGYVDFSPYATNSVFNSNGSFLSEAAAVLGTLSTLNQVSNIVRWGQPNLLDFLFRPKKRRTPPPKTTWNSIFGTRRAAPPPPPPPRPPKPSHNSVFHSPQVPSRPPVSPPPHSAGPRPPKPPAPNPPGRNPGVGGTAPRRHTTPITGPSRSFGPGGPGGHGGPGGPRGPHRP